MSKTMKSEYIEELEESLAWWIDFNSKTPLTLIDVSKLLSIIKRYYVIYPRKKTLNINNKNNTQGTKSCGGRR